MQKAKKLVVFMRVGKSAMSNSPLYESETYIDTFEDENGKLWVGPHYTVLYINVETREAIYGDSLGWPLPMVVEADIDNWSMQISGVAWTESVGYCHDHNIVPHRCKRARRNTCLPNYPFQTCDSVCGPTVVVCAAVASLRADWYRELINTT